MVKTMKNKTLTINKRLQARKRAESRLKAYGIISISIALIMLSTLMISIGLNGYSALQQAYVKLDINVESKNVLDENGEFSNKKALLFLVKDSELKIIFFKESGKGVKSPINFILIDS